MGGPTGDPIQPGLSSEANQGPLQVASNIFQAMKSVSTMPQTSCNLGLSDKCQGEKTHPSLPYSPQKSGWTIIIHWAKIGPFRNDSPYYSNHSTDAMTWGLNFTIRYSNVAIENLLEMELVGNISMVAFSIATFYPGIPRTNHSPISFILKSTARAEISSKKTPLVMVQLLAVGSLIQSQPESHGIKPHLCGARDDPNIVRNIEMYVMCNVQCNIM